MKITIAASHRFHLLDLARELEQLGHDVSFYSYVPTKRCVSFGISKKACHWMWWILPTFLLDKFFKAYFPNIIRLSIIDYVMSLLIKKDTDVFIALSGGYLRAFEKAKKNGAIVIVERGSKHILEQKRILDAIPSLKGKKNVPEFNIKRDLAGYQIADYIAVASKHVKESFLLHGFPEDKLFVNPYGVDLTMFGANKEVEKRYDVIMVGGWSYRKGCDLIVEAIKELKLSLLHVGSLVDLDFPHDPLFTHIDAVDQKELVNYYNQAKIFVLPSREEGMAMVQMQAVSCNLPLVCSKDSGGEDLKQYFGGGKAIFVINQTNKAELKKEILNALAFYNQYQGEDLFDFSGKEQMSWKAYGKRYSDFIHKIVK